MAEIPENVQIHAPELLTQPQRARDTVVTAAMWGVYLYLWVPLISLFAWLLGFEFAYDVMIRTGGARNLLSILFAYSIVIGVIFVAVTVWSLVNRLRFRGVNRRKFSESVADEDLLDQFHVTIDQLRELRVGKVISIELDEHGHPVQFSADP